MIVYVLAVFIWAIIDIAGNRVTFRVSNKQIDNNDIQSKKWNSKVLLMGLVLFLLMALRKETVGFDTRQYIYHYDHYVRVQSFDWVFSQTEMAYWLTIKVLTILNIPWGIYFLAYNFFISYSVTRFIQKHSNTSFWAFYLHLTYGIFSMTLSGMRQSIAMCICLYAYDSLKEKKYVMFAMQVAIAFLFHNSAYVAILLVLLPLLSKKEFNSAKLLVSVGILAAVFIIRVPLFNLAYRFLPQRYVEIGGQMDFTKNKVNPLVVLISVLIPVVCGIFYSETKKKWNEYNEFYVGAIICAAIEILSFNFNLIARTSWYFMMFAVILLGNTVNSFENRNSRTIAKCLCFILPAIMFVMGSDSEASHYLFFWQ